MFPVRPIWFQDSILKMLSSNPVSTRPNSRFGFYSVLNLKKKSKIGAENNSNFNFFGVWNYRKWESLFLLQFKCHTSVQWPLWNWNWNVRNTLKSTTSSCWIWIVNMTLNSTCMGSSAQRIIAHMVTTSTGERKLKSNWFESGLQNISLKS